MLLLSEVIEIICLQITLWAHGNLRLGAEAGLEESGESRVSRIMQSWCAPKKASSTHQMIFFAIPNADTEERRIAAEHRILGLQLPYQIPNIVCVVETPPDGYYTAALLSCCD